MTRLTNRLVRILRAKLASNEPAPLEELESTDPTSERSDEDRWLDVLELSPGASRDEIRASYLKLCKRYHPDRFVASPEKAEMANELMQEIGRAYRGLLGDDR